MSDEKLRIFTHPDIVQAGSYGRQYRADLMCSVCRCVWGKHFGWGCDETVVSLPELLTATVTTTCARCSATIDPDAVEQRHAVCFRVGDYVRWTNEYDPKWHAADPRWFEGTATKVYPSGQGTIGVGVQIERGSAQYNPGDHVGYTNAANLRHIQRPGQAVQFGTYEEGFDMQAAVAAQSKQIAERIKRLDEMRMEHLASKMPKRDAELQDAYEAMEQFTPILPPEVDPLDVVYDGIKLRVLIRIDEDGRQEIRTARNWGHEWTPAQRAAVSAHWSAQLRARISAAKERERLTVCVQDQEEP